MKRMKAGIANGTMSAYEAHQSVNDAMNDGRLPFDIGNIILSGLPSADTPMPEQPGEGSAGGDFRDSGEDPAITVPLTPSRVRDIQEHPLSHEHYFPATGQGGDPSSVQPVAQDEPSVSSDFPVVSPVVPRHSDAGVLPDAMPAEHAEVRDKVEDVVLTSLIGNFVDYRKARQGDEEENQPHHERPDPLDGLLTNYRSARFRSNARKAARGGKTGSLELGKLSDFETRRPGLGSILRDRFILDREIGRGGMGLVYAAVDRRRLEAGSAEPYVALKLLNDTFRHNADALRVLESEARKAQTLAHPNIATVYDFDRDGSEIFIVMELLSGKPLSRLLAGSAGQGLPGRDCVVILRGICDALTFAHQQGVVHSDLKPGNVFVTDRGVVKLLDFGLATATTVEGFDVSTLNALTAPYASPEMFEGAPRAPADDIFALGCIAYQLLTGLHPFAMKASNEAAEAGLVPEPIDDLDPAAWNAVRLALAFERSERIPSVEAFFDALFEA